MAFDPQQMARTIREYRKAAGLTQAELAERAGLAFETISRFESGREPPSLRSAVALADALGASLDALVRRSGTPSPRREKVPPDVRRFLAAAHNLDPKMLGHLVAIANALSKTRARARSPKPRRSR